MWTNAFSGLLGGASTYANPYGGAPTKYGALDFNQQQPMEKQPMSIGGLMGAMGKMGGGGSGYGKMAYQQGLSSGPGGANDMSQYANIQSLMNMAMAKEPQQQRNLQNTYPHMRGLL